MMDYTFRRRNIIRWIVAIIIGVIFSLLMFCSGYYFGWTQEYRALSRQKIGDVLVYTMSLDSIYKYGGPASHHTYTFENAIDMGIIHYVQSRDGGSLGINEIYLGKEFDTTIKRLAKRVAKYRLSHPISMDWCDSGPKCKELIEQRVIIKSKIDSMSQYIIEEK